MSGSPVRLGLRENAAQFSLLAAVTVFVGMMVGLERSTLPLVGREDFHLASSAAVLSFIVAFGIAKALTNLLAGTLADRAGRRRLLVTGWVAALPVAPLVAAAPSWTWVVVANALLGLNQGLAWSMTVVMKVDLVGPTRRGLALGLNEAAGYAGLALAAGLGGLLAASFAARHVLVVAGGAIAVAGLLLSLALVRDTAAHVALEQTAHHDAAGSPPRLRTAFGQASYRVPTLRSCSQAGMVNNLNDGLAWGLVPLFLAARGASVGEIGLVAAVYPGVWAVAQIATGHWSDHAGRKPLIVAGMLVQAAALALLAASAGRVAIATGSAALLGFGTALVYPTLIAAMSDVIAPVARARVVGVYRFWRDLGYALGGLVAGTVADALGDAGAIAVFAGLTAASGLWVLRDMPPRGCGARRFPTSTRCQRRDRGATRTTGERPAGLTPREVEAGARPLVRGRTAAQVADRLRVAPETVANHVARVHATIGVASPVAASPFAMRHGPIDDGAGLVATAAHAKGKRVVMSLTKEAVRLGLPGDAHAIESAGAPPVAWLFQRFADVGGELHVCPIRFDALEPGAGALVAGPRIAGATPPWEFVGDGATVFSY